MNRTTVSAVTMRASLSAVWKAVTDPVLVKRWQFGSDLITDWKIGNPIRFHNEWNGQVFEQWGTVLTFEPQRRLSYTLFFPRPGFEDRPENYFTMTYELAKSGNETMLTITKDDPRDIEEPVADHGENPVFTALRLLVEEN
jgi:uncharacterized protein YndB with AHSA1/START domain